MRRNVRYLDVECVAGYGGSYNWPEIRELLNTLDEAALYLLKESAGEYLETSSIEAIRDIYQFFLEKNTTEISYVLKGNSGHGIRFICEEILAA